jgi:hypothetical protein
MVDFEWVGTYADAVWPVAGVGMPGVPTGRLTSLATHRRYLFTGFHYCRLRDQRTEPTLVNNPSRSMRSVAVRLAPNEAVQRFLTNLRLTLRALVSHCNHWRVR